MRRDEPKAGPFGRPALPGQAPNILRQQLYLNQDTPLEKRPGFIQAAARSHHLLSPAKDNIPASAPTKLLGFPQSPKSLRPRLLPALDAATAPTTHGSLPAIGSRPTLPTAATDTSGPYSAAEVAQYQEAGRIAAEKAAAALAVQIPPAHRPWHEFMRALYKHPYSLEFVYLRHVDSGANTFDPYDLQIVAYKDKGERYYTMTEDGKAEFVPLDQWEKEYHMHQQISQLKVFQLFQKWKSFRLWRRAVTRYKTKTNRTALEKTVFVLNPVFQLPLVAVRNACYDVGRVKLLDLNHTKLYTLQSFFIAQKAHREEVERQLSRFHYATVDTVKEACGEAVAALEEALFGNKSDELGMGDSMRRSGRVDDGARFTHAITAARRSDQRRILAFIRTVDYMKCETMRVMLVDAISELLQVLQHHGKSVLEHSNAPVSSRKAPPTADSASRPSTNHKLSDAQLARLGSAVGSDSSGLTGTSPTAGLAMVTPRDINTPRSPERDASRLGTPLTTPRRVHMELRKPVFTIDIIMDGDELVFSPSPEEFEYQIEDVVGGFVDMISLVERLLNNAELQEFVEPLVSEVRAGGHAAQGTEHEMLGNLAELITDKQPAVLLAELKASLQRAFLDAEAFKLKFEPYMEMVLENRLVTLETMDMQVKSGVRTLETFRADMKRFSAQCEDMESLVSDRDIGILRVQTKRLKDVFIPSPQRCLHCIATLLPQLAAERYKRFVGLLHHAIDKLTDVPTTVEEFDQSIQFLQDCMDKRDAYEIEYQLVCSYYETMDDFDVPVPPEELAAFQTLEPDFVAFKNATDVAESNKDEQTVTFGHELERQIEALNRQVVEIRTRARHEMVSNRHSEVAVVLAYTSQLVGEIAKMQQEAKSIENYQRLFNLPVYRFEELQAASEVIELKHGLWDSLRIWAQLTDRWADSHLEKLEVAELEERCAWYNKMVLRLERGLPNNKVVPILKERVFEFKDMLPIITNLRNPMLKSRHWDKIEAEIGIKVKGNDDFTLGMLMSMKIGEHKEKVVAISTEATQEASLEQLLHKVHTKWNGVEFTVNVYKESKDTFILGSVDDVTATLEDSMVTMATITASRYVAGIRQDVDRLERNLRLFSDTLDEWMECQKNWMYLESVFSAPDIQRQLPLESKAFFTVDKTFKDIMRRTHDRPIAIMAGTTPGWLDTFTRCNTALEQVQKNLEEYLETKRVAFPRFYFLSNDELLEILSQIKNVQAVQPHMPKCFDGIRTLDFGPDPKSIDISAMVSAEGESVDLGKNLKARGNVEAWLTQVEAHMHASLRRRAKQAYTKYFNTPRQEWVLQHPAQLVVTVAQIHWSAAVEAALGDEMVANSTSTLKRLHESSVEQLTQLTALVRSELLPLERKVIVPLITIDVHSRDILEQLVQEHVSTASAFGWQMQLRFYWDAKEDEVHVRQTNARFVYGYEYLGAQPRLVVTPMTDRCYMTLTGALNLNLGGAPAGPAGTGKTETTKDLGKALGVQCVVFNCGENLDFKFMGKFFSGLAQCGAWACFDEFNRIDIEVLSVVAQQLLCIQTALKASLRTFVFEGRDIRLQHSVGVFITMNPGYAGRTELPDNLKALFRPMAMMVPDYALVAEVMLFSEGFNDAKTLSRKMVKLYKLSSEQLSQQDHYDFGMRALKSVLVMAGALKRSRPEHDETAILICAMRDANLPKFLYEDAALFQAIIADLFPGSETPIQDYGELEQALRQVIPELNLLPTDEFVLKATQLWETFNVRFGVMLVGPTGGGKTRIYQALQAACTLLRRNGSADTAYQTTHTRVLNPKCVKMGELYGEYNLLTNEWRDGVASTLIRHAVADASPARHWVVFDGPVDAVWIESMNTVLDDNCTLCLPNGERIKLNPVTMRILFEVQDLAVASPATVSRCGMVYVPPEAMGWRPYVKMWLQQQMGPLDMSQLQHDYMWTLFKDYVDPALTFVRTQCREPIPSVDINLVTSLTFLLQALLAPGKGPNFRGQEDDWMPMLNHIFTFCFIWSIGGNLDLSSMEKFDMFVRSLMGSFLAFPTSANVVYEFFVDTRDGGFREWGEIVPTFEYTPQVPYFNLIVPTVDTVRYRFLLDALLGVEKAVLVSAGTGVGKTVIISEIMKERNAAGTIVPININFSAQTTSIATQELIESKLEKKRKTRFGAPVGKRLLCFVDDVNMPALEVYGAQPPIELLRQWLDFHGVYDRKKLFWKSVEDMNMVVACAPPGGGRNEVTPRFFRHFNMLCLQPPSEMVMRHIFLSILTGFLQPFPQEFKPLAKPMVDSTVSIFLRIQNELLPTPAKSHYTFNLRDVSRVFQGVLMVTTANCADRNAMARLWTHENARVFHDRLIDTADKQYFTHMLYDILVNRLSVTESYEALFEERTIMFGDYLRIGAVGDDRQYEEVTSMPRLSRLLEEYLDEFNMASNSTMKLVFFLDAIEHISRIARVLRQPRGNALLVGVGGSGKQSLTRFACFMAECQCFQLELSRGYGMTEFREDIKKLYKVAGIQGKPVTFLFTDNQIANEGFVEDINNVLNTGEVPGLFQADERDRIMDELRPYAIEHGITETRDAMYDAFIDRVRNNLHLVLAMSPVGEAFRTRCRQFPSLINCCTIDWYNDWPEAALLSVSSRFLHEMDVGGATDHTSDEVKAQLATMCVQMHMTVTLESERYFQELRRRFYTTPKSYLDLIGLYSSLLEERRAALSSNRDRLVNGLEKLRETNALVDLMQTELNELQPVLAEKTQLTQQLLQQVTRDQEEASLFMQQVLLEEDEVARTAAETQAMKDEAQADLDEAMPALHASMEALGALNKGDITEIKSFVKPPALVQKTMQAVNTLLQEKPDWETAKKVLTDSQLTKRLMDFDKDSIPDHVIKQIRRFTDDASFQPENVAKQSNAAKSLCLWVHAMDKYDAVSRLVAPKKEALRRSEAALLVAMEQLKDKQAQSRKVERQVAQLKQQLEDSQREEQSLAKKMEVTNARLVRAGKLTTSLADEEARWRKTAEELAASMDLLVGDVFLCAAAISYIGPFTGQYREALLTEWHARCVELRIPVSEQCSLFNTLSDAVEVRAWTLWGLPTDTVSVDNAIMVTRGQRWPLMIDPQSQADTWIKAMEAKNNVRMIKLTDPNFLRTLESAIRIGSPVLCEDVGETLDPVLEPILQKQVFTQGNRMLIRVGDSEVDYDPGFKFYLTTKLPNPHYLPEVCIKVAIINFTVTARGLEDQLLGDLVRKERPDLEETKDRLVINIASDKKQLKDLEDKILLLLKESEGNLLDDEVLIHTLNNSKETSLVTQQRVLEAERTEQEINQARERYRVVPHRGSLLFFVIADLGLVDPMYQYSLSYFSSLFNKCIDLSAKSENLNERLNTLLSFITAFVYRNVCRGLFEEHKMIFSFLISTTILRDPVSGRITTSEWNFFLRGATSLEDTTASTGAARPELAFRPKFLTDAKCSLLKGMERAVPTMANVVQHILLVPAEYTAFMCSKQPFDCPIPGGFNDTLTLFQKLLLVKVMHDGKMVAALVRFVAESLGVEFTQSPPAAISDLYRDTSKVTPIIFILSTGAVPTDALQTFGRKMGKESGEKLHIISLGQGQGPIAESTVAKATRSGDWVCLQNCHLASSWMMSLERIVESLQTDPLVHDDFRLWLTSMPSPQFPVLVLQNGIKVTSEPPRGIRSNLLRTFGEFSPEFLDASSKPVAWRKLVFACSFFHAVIQERRKFGPIGWNKHYDFSQSDLECSLQTLRMFLDEQGDIPWAALLYVTGQINYGGRVTDDLDRRCLMCILETYYTPRVLDEGNLFSASGSYMVPGEGVTTLEQFRAFISAMPPTDEPELFGMHENANITFQLQEASKTVETVLNMQPRVSATVGDGAPSADTLVSQMAAAIRAKLPKPLRREDAGRRTFSDAAGALGTVLAQEMDRFNRLLTTMDRTLQQLGAAIQGLVVMSNDLEVMYTGLLNNQVPQAWHAVAYLSLKPLASWVTDFHRKFKFMRMWLTNGSPRSFWLPGFFFPQGFLTGVLQNHARKYQIPIDTLTFGFSLLDVDTADGGEVMVAPDDGVYIDGLYLDGAQWHRAQHHLQEPAPSQMFSPLPIIHFIPKLDYTPPVDQYQAPLVLSISLALPPDGPASRPEFWVLAGVACLCALSD